ncbi:MAG: hypothetical protein IT224_06400 [Flavobacteriales bacterium]|nr:hypothetical protein [Flavobacteriales bacterium]
MNPFATLRNTILICTILIHGAVSAQQILTNQDLIQMAQLDMGEAIILRSIDNSNNDFDVSTPALLQMKAAGLGDAVLAKVIQAGSSTTHKVVDANDPLAPHRPGIYFFDDNGNMVELLPSVTSQSKTKGALANRLSYGIAKARVVSRVSGPAAREQFTVPQEFYFYFNQQLSAFDDNAIAFYGFQQAMSPNEFLLAELDVQDDVRELETGSANNYTSEAGIDEKHSRSFEIERLASGVFKVTAASLPSGQYCFVYSGAAPYGHTQQKVYDFGVQ